MLLAKKCRCGESEFALLLASIRQPGRVLGREHLLAGHFLAMEARQPFGNRLHAIGESSMQPRSVIKTVLVGMAAVLIPQGINVRVRQASGYFLGEFARVLFPDNVGFAQVVRRRDRRIWHPLGHHGPRLQNLPVNLPGATGL